MSNRLSLGLVLLMTIAACSAPSTPPAQAQAPAAEHDGAQHVRLVGHHDLQGREALVVTTLSDPANGNWVYVGHHESYWDDKPKMNPITNRMEWNGTSILEISDPSKPRLVWHIPNEVNANSRGVTVVYDYKFDGSGRDYLIRNSEHGDTLKFQVFDITSRATDPSKISLVSEITATPQNSCGPGCGGKFIQRAHKGHWSPETGYFYSAAGEPGFRSTISQIWDLKDPKNPKPTRLASGVPQTWPALAALARRPILTRTLASVQPPRQRAAKGGDADCRLRSVVRGSHPHVGTHTWFI